MKKEILLSALLIATLAACTGKGPARKFKETAERLNQTYPIRLNETITIDSTHYNEKDNTVSYYYTVTGELMTLNSWITIMPLTRKPYKKLLTTR